MLDLYTLSDDGTPVRCVDWAAWAAMATSTFRLALTDVGPGSVSTIFLGWDNRRRRSGPPLMFETMTLGVPGLEGEAERYATRGEALAGHARAVERARRAVGLAVDTGDEDAPPPAA